MPAHVHLETPEPGSRLFEEAKALGDSETRNLGLLPHAAWDDYAGAGHILVATEQGRLLGYTAYRVPRAEVRIAHLVVHPDARGQGISRVLVGELARRHHERRGIGLRCRRDWAANRVWPALGFVSVGEKPGRGSDAGVLTEWWYDFGHPDLFSWAPGDSTLTAVIDTNVFIDLHSDNPTKTSRTTRRLIGTLTDRVDLVVTPELLNELHRQEDAAERQRLIQTAQTYPSLPGSIPDVDSWAERLDKTAGQRKMSAQDRSDRRHVAWAAAAGAPIVVTRDRKARRTLKVVAYEAAGVTLCTPSTLASVIHEREHAGAYAPVALSATELLMREISSDPDAAGSLLSTGTGERRGDFDRRLEEISAARPNSRLTLMEAPGGEALAIVGTAARDSALTVSVARVQAGPLEATMAAQIAQYLRTTARELACSSIVVKDPHLSRGLPKALQSDGFTKVADDQLVALTLDERVRSTELDSVLRRATNNLGTPQADALLRLAQALATDSPAALEHAFRPLRLLDADLPTWLVPIRPHWASELFGHPAMLMPRSLGLGLSTEHVYYKKGKAGETSPGRVLWYASGDPGREVFGCSLLMEVRDGQAKELYRDYRRLGIYSFDEVVAAADKNGSVRALNVTDTELLPAPVSLRKLRSLAAGTGDKINLVTARRISQALFQAIVREGHRDAD
ncbi:MAG: GNAT family N-acetyltransferase [Humibacillus sp.]|nr:GNAT family N-acetyltransferase [Humibacillus sp.]MDN5778993.1 GNAT family N-acetyltransferase [Humibacillus sp.]